MQMCVCFKLGPVSVQLACIVVSALVSPTFKPNITTKSYKSSLDMSSYIEMGTVGRASNLKREKSNQTKKLLSALLLSLISTAATSNDIGPETEPCNVPISGPQPITCPPPLNSPTNKQE